MKHYWLRYSDDMPRESIGIQRFFMIKIRPAYKDSRSVLAHEVAHIGNWYTALFLTLLALAPVVYAVPPLWPILFVSVLTHEFLYKFVTAYRRYDEVIGHRAEYKAGGNLESLARNLSSAYKLKITEAEARRLIEK